MAMRPCLPALFSSRFDPFMKSTDLGQAIMYKMKQLFDFANIKVCKQVASNLPKGTRSTASTRLPAAPRRRAVAL
jgi:hypothetical protein